MDLDKKMDKNLFESLFHVIAFKFQRADFIINRYKIKVNASILSISWFKVNSRMDTRRKHGS